MALTDAIAKAAFMAACLCGFVCAMISFVNQLRMTAHRKDGVPLFPNWYGGPLGVYYRPDQLTERGQSIRRWFYYGWIGFFVSVAAAFAIAMSGWGNISGP